MEKLTSLLKGWKHYLFKKKKCCTTYTEDMLTSEAA